MHWSCRRKRYTFWSWSFLEWDWICMELLYLYIWWYIWLLYINRYTYVYSLYVYIYILYTIFWVKTMISITALFQCFFWVVPAIEQADQSIESYLPLTMHLPFSLTNLGAQPSRKLLDLERIHIYPNSSHIMSYWPNLTAHKSKINDFAHIPWEDTSNFPKLPQRKKFLHKLLVKFPGYLPGVCGWDLRQTYQTYYISSLLFHHFPNLQKTTATTFFFPTPPGQVVSLCAGIVANPRSFDQWISLMKLAASSAIEDGADWLDGFGSVGFLAKLCATIFERFVWL